MFNFFRSQGKAAKYLLGFLLSLVGLSMLLYLVPNYNNSTNSSNPVLLEVGKTKLLANEAMAIVQQQTNGKGPAERGKSDGPQGINDPQKPADLGNAFPLRHGYTVVWSGWDPDAPRANLGLGLTAPVATDNGRPIVQTVRDEFCSGTRGD